MAYQKELHHINAQYLIRNGTYIECVDIGREATTTHDDAMEEITVSSEKTSRNGMFPSTSSLPYAQVCT